MYKFLMREVAVLVQQMLYTRTLQLTEGSPKSSFPPGRQYILGRYMIQVSILIRVAFLALSVCTPFARFIMH